MIDDVFLPMFVLGIDCYMIYIYNHLYYIYMIYSLIYCVKEQDLKVRVLLGFLYYGSLGGCIVCVLQTSRVTVGAAAGGLHERQG